MSKRLGHVRIHTEKLAPYGVGAADEECEDCNPLLPRRAVRVCISTPKKPGAVLRSHLDVCRVLRNAKRADRESLYVLHLDTKNRIIGVEEVARGSVNEVSVHQREVFKGAILSNAASIIVAHNHPSGEALFSQGDMDLTKQLVAAGKLLGIPLRDHVLIAARGCTSIQAIAEEQLRGPRLRRRRR